MASMLALTFGDIDSLTSHTAHVWVISPAHKDDVESDREDMDQAEGDSEYDIEDGDDDLEALAPEALSSALAQEMVVN
ncbi:hypothetical protein B0H14DRAFT_3448438 [Mycena olivaceomarginata]|nr:hypothetical protein B0H14DRAFT_3448438 [Mycena olivaceomarginata]